MGAGHRLDACLNVGMCCGRFDFFWLVVGGWRLSLFDEMFVRIEDAVFVFVFSFVCFFSYGETIVIVCV